MSTVLTHPAPLKSRGVRTETADSRQAERAYGELRRLLSLQKIPEGQRVREAEWTQRLEVGRGALREAMARLEAEGLLIKLPLRGYAVPDMTASDVAEACETRFLLESGALQRIFRLGLNTEEGLRPLAQASEQFELLAAQGYYFAVMEAEWRYHEALVAAAGNRRLTMLYRRVFMSNMPATVAGHEEPARALPRILEEHRGILQALREGDAVRAESILRSHLMREVLEEGGPVGRRVAAC